jgi:uncharacterized damage-inducible protein DinB
MSAVPDRTEAADYYFRYIDLIPGGGICEHLESQGEATRTLLAAIAEARSGHRYAVGKWSIREVVGHLIDCERLFVGRAFWFARGFETSLPSFDQDVAMAASGADLRPWSDLQAEFQAVRASTAYFFRSLPEAAWARRGIASDKPFTVRALAYLTAGHVTHHLSILRERYLPA